METHSYILHEDGRTELSVLQGADGGTGTRQLSPLAPPAPIGRKGGEAGGREGPTSLVLGKGKAVLACLSPAGPQSGTQGREEGAGRLAITLLLPQALLSQGEQ